MIHSNNLRQLQMLSSNLGINYVYLHVQESQGDLQSLKETVEVVGCIDKLEQLKLNWAKTERILLGSC